MSNDDEYKENILKTTGACCRCGKNTPTVFLSFSPETEDFIRKTGLKEPIPENLDLSLFCPSCRAEIEKKNG